MMNQVVVSQQTGYARNASESAYPNLWRGLVGWWLPSVNPRGGNRLFDLSPFRNHGTLTNMTSEDWVVSGGAGALDFDGTDDRVTATFPSGISIASVSAWINPTTTINSSSSTSVIIQIKGPSTSDVFWYLTVGNATSLLSNEYFTILESNLDFRVGVADGGSISGWTHLAVAWNGTTYLMYINGVQKTTVSSSTPSLGISSKDHVTIGATQTGGALFSGKMDDIRIYNRSLTPSEIRQLASRRGIGLQPRPKQFTYYQFPSGSKRRRILTGMT